MDFINIAICNLFSTLRFHGKFKVVELSVPLKCFPAKFSKWKVDNQMDVSDPKRKQNTVPVDGNSNENQCVRKNMSELEYYQQN